MQRQMPRLRTKTGCSPCKHGTKHRVSAPSERPRDANHMYLRDAGRLSKKKCDETLPTCWRCQAGGRVCEWPNAADLTDRRHLIHRPVQKAKNECKMPELSLNDSFLVQVTSARAIETVLSRHFTFGFYELILLPGCSQHFYNGWLAQLCQLAKSCPSLYNSLLACAASHLYMMDGADTMLQLGLTYYSNAIRQLLRSLANDKHSQEDEGLLSAIIFLIIHGVCSSAHKCTRPTPKAETHQQRHQERHQLTTLQCQGLQTFDDIPNHMGAATQIMLKVLQPMHAPRRYLDAVLVESVLFHSLHACTGLWSDTRNSLQYTFDYSLWKKAELYLSDSTGPSGTASRIQGPVLGVPTPLLRLAIQLRQLYRNPLSFSVEEIQVLHAEGLEWERKVLFVEESSTRPKPSPDFAHVSGDECCKDISILYVLAVSLLLSNLSINGLSNYESTMTPPWQLGVAAEILRKHESDQDWQRSYMGNWPVYTLGSFASNTSARKAMQTDLQRRWTLTKMGQSKRFLDDMEAIWNKSEAALADWSCAYSDLEPHDSSAELHSTHSSEVR